MGYKWVNKCNLTKHAKSSPQSFNITEHTFSKIVQKPETIINCKDHQQVHDDVHNFVGSLNTNICFILSVANNEHYCLFITLNHFHAFVSYVNQLATQIYQKEIWAC